MIVTSGEVLFCDGGVVGRNPSLLGGTWAWVLVRGDQILRSGSGVVTPADIGTPQISNNQTELIAALRAITAMERGWRGTLFTDSLLTLRRITYSKKFKNIPNCLRLKALYLRRHRRWDAQVCGGHPTDEELRVGKRTRNGFPISKWNVWCDTECSRLAKAFLEEIKPNS